MPSVAIVGASPKPERYSHQAVLAYQRLDNWSIWPVHPSGKPVVEGLETYPDLQSLPGRPDIICMYVNPNQGLQMLDAIKTAQPHVLWLNPGTESPELVDAARSRGLKVFEACTLVVLRLHNDPLAVANAQ